MPRPGHGRSVTRALSDIIPDPDTRAFIGRVYRAWGEDWAAVLTRDLHSGDLIDMGYINYRPELEGKREYHQHGENKYIIGANGKCWFCGQTVEKEPNPAQLTPESHSQLKMEVR